MQRKVVRNLRMAVVPVILSVALTAAAAGAPASKVVFFSSDGMRPDLMETYAAQGAMPTYLQLMGSGVRGVNGLLPPFPPITGTGWHTLATGTWPGEHGATNNTFHRIGEGNFNTRVSFTTTGILQADTLAAAAERAGKRVAQIEWVGGRAANIAGPTVDFSTFSRLEACWQLPSTPPSRWAPPRSAFRIRWRRSLQPPGGPTSRRATRRRRRWRRP